MANLIDSVSGTLVGAPSMTVGRPRSVRGKISETLKAPIIALANLAYKPYLPNIEVEPDWEAMAAYNYPRIRFIYVRGGISWGYVDKRFERTWKALKMYTNIPRSMYHVPYMSQSVRGQVDNIERIFDLVGGDMGEGPIIEDWELKNDQAPNRVSYVMGQMVNEVQNNFNRRADIYSADWFIRAYAEQQAWMKDVLWILAHYSKPIYGEHLGPPAKPDIIPRENVAWHQSGSYFDGRVMGVPGNTRVDGNRLERSSGLTLERYLVDYSQPTPDFPPKPDINVEMSMRVKEII